MTIRTETHEGREVDAVVVGAGFSGLYMVHKLRKDGFSVQGFERASDVGGTWYWNRFPGACCDAYSLQYSYSFDEKLEQEWTWTRQYASQPEILRYLSHVADRFDLRPSFAFDTVVESANWTEETHRWQIRTNGGDVIDARYLILGTGALSADKVPDIAGVEDFAGEMFSTSTWPAKGVQLVGKRVAVIGTGSSGVQVIPLIAEEAEHLTVFQRTPVFSVPASNDPLSPEYQAQVKAHYRDVRKEMRDKVGGMNTRSTGRAALDTPEDERKAAFEEAWKHGGHDFATTFTDLLVDVSANNLAAEFIRGKIRDIVSDPEVAESLSPRDYPLASKRMCLDTNYYSTYNRKNVTLKDLRKAPLQRIVAKGVETTEGVIEVDTLVLAIGFDALTGSFSRIGIRGVDGESLPQKWGAGYRTYLGLMSQGFPNLFFITGPGSPAVLSNMPVSIEQHVEWISACLTTLRKEGQTRIEAAADAEEKWVTSCSAIGAQTIFGMANSWYVGANVPGKPRVLLPFAGGVPAYRDICNKVVADDYAGFTRT